MRISSVTPYQTDFIIAHASEFTVKQLCDKLDLVQSAVRWVGHVNNLTFKSARPEPVKREYVRTHSRAIVPDKPKPAIQRPAAEYNQVPSPYGISTEMRKL